jgi:uncharacterized protein (UPF0333 family)
MDSNFTFFLVFLGLVVAISVAAAFFLNRAKNTSPAPLKVNASHNATELDQINKEFMGQVPTPFNRFPDFDE